MEAIGIAVMSLDGCLTRHAEEGTEFASATDRRFFLEALHSFDCALMGGRGYRAARSRTLEKLSPNLLRVVLTRTPERHAIDERRGLLEFTSAEPDEALRGLRDRGYARCAVIGGGRTLTACLHERVLDELWVTVEPMAFGEGQRLIHGASDFRFELLKVEALDPNTLLLRYRPAHA